MAKAKAKKTEEKLETIEVYYTESFSTWVVREPITLNISNYPELEGMSEEQIKDYIKENASEMASPSDWADNLQEYLSQTDVIREKITDEDWNIEFK